MEQKLSDLNDDYEEENEEDEEDEEDEVDGIPTSSAILGMKLGDHHVRKNSDGKSSMMGLSALGLESHRESCDNPSSDLQMIDQAESEFKEQDHLDISQ